MRGSRSAVFRLSIRTRTSIVTNVVTIASAVLAASLFHFQELSINQVKDYLAGRDILVRRQKLNGRS